MYLLLSFQWSTVLVRWFPFKYPILQDQLNVDLHGYLQTRQMVTILCFSLSLKISTEDQLLHSKILQLIVLHMEVASPPTTSLLLTWALTLLALTMHSMVTIRPASTIKSLWPIILWPLLLVNLSTDQLVTILVSLLNLQWLILLQRNSQDSKLFSTLSRTTCRLLISGVISLLLWCLLSSLWAAMRLLSFLWFQLPQLLVTNLKNML